MARIVVRRRKEPVIVSEERGRRVKQLRFGDENGNGKVDPETEIDLGDDWAGRVDQIVSVEIIKDTEAIKADKLLAGEDKGKQEARDFHAEVQRLILLSPAERAKHTALAEYVWTSVYGTKPSEKTLTMIRQKQEKFFKKHMNYAWANPTCYLDEKDVKISGQKKHYGQDQTARTAGSMLANAALLFAARQVSNGIV